MIDKSANTIPTTCPVCASELRVTRLQCPACGSEVSGNFSLARLAALPEPHASLIEMFLRVRGNVKDMERALGLSYPTVRARLEEAFQAAGFDRDSDRPIEQDAIDRRAVLDALQAGEITAKEASERLKNIGTGRSKS